MVFINDEHRNTYYEAANRPTAQQLLNSPTTSFWLKEAIRTCLNRDCLDAFTDADLLLEVCRDHMTEQLRKERRDNVQQVQPNQTQPNHA